MFKNFSRMAALLLAMLILGAASANAADFQVSAAASLKEAFEELKNVFEKQHPGDVAHLNFAASNPLLRQIEAGAPVDVFASADQATMDKAVQAKVVDPATRVNFASNDLVIIVPKNAKKPGTLDDLTKLERIAIGNPDSVPAGRYTRQALQTAGLWDKLAPKFIQGESVRQALDYVARGEVNAGFVYGTDAKQREKNVDIAFVAPGHDPVSYPIAVALTGNNPKAGQEFLKFVCSPEGQAILAKYGFQKP